MAETSQLQTRSIACRYVLGQIVDMEAVDWACALLAQGADSEHLRLVAGYTRQEIEQDLDAFRGDLRSAFLEMGVSIPAKPVAFSEFACFICEQYLEGSLSYRSALAGLYQIGTETNYNPKNKIDDRFDVWVYFDDSVSLAAEGYRPLLEEFEGLNADNQESFSRVEAERFLQQYQPRAEQNKD